MKLKFTKMQGTGNDFVVIDAISQDVHLTSEQIRTIADRHFGIGCDQVLMVRQSERSDVDFAYRIFNADGGEVEQCGNGARCFARFVYDHNLTNKNLIRVDTLSGIISLKIEADNQVTINMGIPKFAPGQIPFDVAQQRDYYSIEVNGKSISFAALSMGNPHLVIKVDNIDTAPVNELGSQLQQHEQFPNRVNVGFMQVIDKNEIRLRVFERGVGETLSCGTGACAAVVAGRQWGLLSDKVLVHLPGGQLSIQWSGNHQFSGDKLGKGTGSEESVGQPPVYLTGPAQTVFEGQINI